MRGLDFAGGAHGRVDGLVLHRSDAAYRNGTAYGAVYKWKPEHTVDLRGVGKELSHATGPLADIDGRRAVVLPSRVTVGKESDVAEYHIDTSVDGEVRLFAIRTRPDKCFPNSEAVVCATVRDCVEAIQPSEIAGAVHSRRATTT